MTYESTVPRNWYLLFHYGTADEILEGTSFSRNDLPPRALDFPIATVEEFRGKSHGRALDVGCAVGRSSFALSRMADEVIGVDFSESFVSVAEELRRGGKIPYQRYSEGHLTDNLTAILPESSRPKKVQFLQGDAMNLPEDLGSFDWVHAANLLCRLSEPKRFLDWLPDHLNPGGQVVMATPATWMTDYTPKINQPPGLTLDFLRENLAGDFDLISVKELPFLIRQHQRKLQLSTSQTSLWRRK